MHGGRLFRDVLQQQEAAGSSLPPSDASRHGSPLSVSPGLTPQTVFAVQHSPPVQSSKLMMSSSSASVSLPVLGDDDDDLSIAPPLSDDASVCGSSVTSTTPATSGGLRPTKSSDVLARNEIDKKISAFVDLCQTSTKHQNLSHHVAAAVDELQAVSDTTKQESSCEVEFSVELDPEDVRRRQAAHFGVRLAEAQCLGASETRKCLVSDSSESNDNFEDPVTLAKEAAEAQALRICKKYVTSSGRLHLPQASSNTSSLEGSDTLVDADSGAVIQQWRSRCAARDYIRVLRALSCARHALLLPTSVKVPAAVSVACGGSVFTVTWLVPLQVAIAAPVDAFGHRTCEYGLAHFVLEVLLEYFQYPLHVLLDTPLQLYLGADDALYVLPTSNMMRFQATCVSRLPDSSAYERFEYLWIDDVSLLERNTRSTRVVLGAGERHRVTTAIESRLVPLLKMHAVALVKLAKTDTRWLSRVFHACGVGMKFMLVVRNAIRTDLAQPTTNPSKGGEQARKALEALCALIVTEVLARSVKTLILRQSTKTFDLAAKNDMSALLRLSSTNTNDISSLNNTLLREDLPQPQASQRTNSFASTASLILQKVLHNKKFLATTVMSHVFRKYDDAATLELDLKDIQVPLVIRHLENRLGLSFAQQSMTADQSAQQQQRILFQEEPSCCVLSFSGRESMDVASIVKDEAILSEGICGRVSADQRSEQVMAVICTTLLSLYLAMVAMQNGAPGSDNIFRSAMNRCSALLRSLMKDTARERESIWVSRIVAELSNNKSLLWRTWQSMSTFASTTGDNDVPLNLADGVVLASMMDNCIASVEELDGEPTSTESPLSKQSALLPKKELLSQCVIQWARCVASAASWSACNQAKSIDKSGATVGLFSYAPSPLVPFEVTDFISSDQLGRFYKTLSTPYGALLRRIPSCCPLFDRGLRLIAWRAVPIAPAAKVLADFVKQNLERSHRKIEPVEFSTHSDRLALSKLALRVRVVSPHCWEWFCAGLVLLKDEVSQAANPTDSAQGATETNVCDDDALAQMLHAVRLAIEHGTLDEIEDDPEAWDTWLVDSANGGQRLLDFLLPLTKQMILAFHQDARHIEEAGCSSSHQLAVTLYIAPTPSNAIIYVAFSLRWTMKGAMDRSRLRGDEKKSRQQLQQDEDDSRTKSFEKFHQRLEALAKVHQTKLDNLAKKNEAKAIRIIEGIKTKAVASRTQNLVAHFVSKELHVIQDLRAETEARLAREAAERTRVLQEVEAKRNAERQAAEELLAQQQKDAADAKHREEVLSRIRNAQELREEQRRGEIVRRVTAAKLAQILEQRRAAQVARERDEAEQRERNEAMEQVRLRLEVRKKEAAEFKAVAFASQREDDASAQREHLAAEAERNRIRQELEKQEERYRLDALHESRDRRRRSSIVPKSSAAAESGHSPDVTAETACSPAKKSVKHLRQSISIVSSPTSDDELSPQQPAAPTVVSPSPKATQGKLALNVSPTNSVKRSPTHSVSSHLSEKGVGETPERALRKSSVHQQAQGAEQENCNTSIPPSTEELVSHFAELVAVSSTESTAPRAQQDDISAHAALNQAKQSTVSKILQKHPQRLVSSKRSPEEITKMISELSDLSKAIDPPLQTTGSATPSQRLLPPLKSNNKHLASQPAQSSKVTPRISNITVAQDSPTEDTMRDLIARCARLRSLREGRPGFLPGKAPSRKRDDGSAADDQELTALLMELGKLYLANRAAAESQTVEQLRDIFCYEAKREQLFYLCRSPTTVHLARHAGEEMLAACVRSSAMLHRIPYVLVALSLLSAGCHAVVYSWRATQLALLLMTECIPKNSDSCQHTSLLDVRRAFPLGTAGSVSDAVQSILKRFSTLLTCPVETPLVRVCESEMFARSDDSALEKSLAVYEVLLHSFHALHVSLKSSVSLAERVTLTECEWVSQTFHSSVFALAMGLEGAEQFRSCLAVRRWHARIASTMLGPRHLTTISACEAASSKKLKELALVEHIAATRRSDCLSTRET